MIEADKTSSPICKCSATNQHGQEETYHPSITTPSVHEPTCDLACSLYNQQAAEALGQLEERRGVSQHLVPGANRQHLEQAPGAKYPLLHTRVLRSLPVERPRHPVPAVI